jgi:hypothetical protein
MKNESGGAVNQNPSSLGNPCDLFFGEMEKNRVSVTWGNS